MTPLLTGQVDVVTGWTTNVTALKPLGPDRVAMRLWDQGIRLYAMPYYATNETLANEPHLLEAFLRAAGRGWELAFRETERAVQILVEEYPILRYQDELDRGSGAPHVCLHREDARAGLGHDGARDLGRADREPRGAAAVHEARPYGRGRDDARDPRSDGRATVPTWGVLDRSRLTLERFSQVLVGAGRDRSPSRRELRSSARRLSRHPRALGLRKIDAPPRRCGFWCPPLPASVSIFGRSPSEARRARELGFVFQDAALLPWRTVRENVELPLEVGGSARASRTASKAEELLELVGLSKWLRAYPHELSGGMRQRVSIARALVTGPKILLMDEPFGALDEITRDRLNDELRRIWRETGTTILFVTHSIPEALYLGERVLMLAAHPGRVREMVTAPFPSIRDLSLRESSDFVKKAGELRGILETCG